MQCDAVNHIKQSKSVGQNGRNFGERRISGKDATRIDIGAVEANNLFVLALISTGGAKLYSFWAGGSDIGMQGGAICDIISP